MVLGISFFALVLAFFIYVEVEHGPARLAVIRHFSSESQQEIETRIFRLAFFKALIVAVPTLVLAVCYLAGSRRALADALAALIFLATVRFLLKVVGSGRF